jgi:dTDP-4-dehydrorhamnose 3,5-epimerase
MNRKISIEVEGLKLSKCEVFSDSRGRFIKFHHNKDSQSSETSIATSFNPVKGTIRGLHFQIEPYAEEKSITCLQGSIFDVIVDLRPESKSFGRWMSIELSATNALQICLPKGVAHGFQTLEANSVVQYVLQGAYAPEYAHTINPFGDLEICWPIDDYLISENDLNGISFNLASRIYIESLVEKL